MWIKKHSKAIIVTSDDRPLIFSYRTEFTKGMRQGLKTVEGC